MKKVKYGENPRKLAHNDTVYVEEIFTKEQMQNDNITYGACWAILNPGMIYYPKISLACKGGMEND